MVTELLSRQKLLSPRLRPRVEQVMNLIGRGKEFVALRDPALRVITQTLLAMGVRSAEEIGRALIEQKQEEARKATFERVLVEEMRRVGRARLEALEGATAGESLRQLLKSERFKRLGTPRKGTITRAVDVGGGKMQDVRIEFKDGKIFSEKFLGKPIPQTTRFKQRKDLSRILIERRRPIEQQRIFRDVGLQDFGERAKLFETLPKRARIETERLLEKKDLTGKEKRMLLAIQFTLPSLQFIRGLTQLPAFTKSLVKNPKNITKVPGQIWTGLKETGLEIVALAKVDPRLAAARIGGEIILLKAIGDAFRIIGKVGKGAGKAVAPALRRVRGGMLVVKRVGTKGLVKLKLVSGKTAKFIRKKSKLAEVAIKKAEKVKVVVKKEIRVTKAAQKLEVRRFRGRVEFANQLKKARNVRRLARRKGRTISIGTNDYIEAVAFIEEIADILVMGKARQFIKALKARGIKFGLGQEDDFIKAARVYVNKSLNKMPKFRSLKEYARLQRPFQIKLLRARKISPATKLIKSINLKIRKLPLVKEMKSIFKRIKKVKKLPSKIKKKLVKKRLEAIGRREFRKTIRYHMEKTRPIRKVTLEQLQKSNTISKMNKFVDRFFDEMGRRQNIKISSLKFKQLKNVIKKRLRHAIKTGNKAEISKFTKSVKKLINDMNKPAKKPAVKIVNKFGKPKRVRTIKDFTPEVRRGEYIEVRKGQQVLLQKVKQVQKLKPAQRLLQQQKQTFIIQSVQKQVISMMPLVKFSIDVLVDIFIRSLGRQKTKQKAAQAFDSLLKITPKTETAQDAKQDLKILQQTLPALKIVQKVKQDVLSRQRFRLVSRLRPEQVGKKKVIRRRILRITPKKKKRKIKDTGYVSSVKKPIRRKLNVLPLTRERALDLLAFMLDKNPAIKGRTIKSLKKVKISVLKRKLKLAPKGYFKRHRRKFILRKLRKGRETYEMIERKKYRKDSKGERTTSRKIKRRRTTRRRIKR